jgi:replication-associated recombination protein RarA
VNEKIDFRYLIAGLILLICGMVAGCRSQPTIAGSIVIQSAEDLGRLKEQNRQLAAIADDFVSGIESIEGRISNAQSGIESAQADARGAEQDIDAAIRLFIEYKRRVDQFIADYRELQDPVENSD